MEILMAKKYYAVRAGRTTGIFTTWDDCRAQVIGFKGAEYKSFPTMQEAQDFLNRTALEKPKPDGPSEGQPPPEEQDKAVAYVDGSYNSHTREFSCGAVLFYRGEKILFSKKYNDSQLAEMHNVAGEIKGAEEVIRHCLEHEIPALEIHHDYEGVGKWAQGVWKANKPGTQAYAAFCREAGKRLPVTFVKVKGHSGDVYNDLTDQLAKKALGLA